MTSEPSAGRWKNLKKKRSLAHIWSGLNRSLWDICYGTAPPQMVEEQGDIQAKCDPLSSTHEHQTEEPMDGVLRHHKLTRKHREEVKPSATISTSKRLNPFTMFFFTVKIDFTSTFTAPVLLDGCRLYVSLVTSRVSWMTGHLVAKNEQLSVMKRKSH